MCYGSGLGIQLSEICLLLFLIELVGESWMVGGNNESICKTPYYCLECASDILPTCALIEISSRIFNSETHLVLFCLHHTMRVDWNIFVVVGASEPKVISSSGLEMQSSCTT